MTELAFFIAGVFVGTFVSFLFVGLASMARRGDEGMRL